MRFAVGVLVCLNAGAISLALGDPPAIPPATTATAAAADATPAAPVATSTVRAPTVAPTTAAPKPTVDLDEKHFASQGYKTEMRNGEKVFCRREQVLGTRLGEEKHCATLEQLKVLEQESKDTAEKFQRTQKNPHG
jgi:hypothetical protein